jgi:hypothetical protein
MHLASNLAHLIHRVLDHARPRQEPHEKAESDYIMREIDVSSRFISNNKFVPLRERRTDDRFKDNN